MGPALPGPPGDPGGNRAVPVRSRGPGRRASRLSRVPRAPYRGKAPRPTRPPGPCGCGGGSPLAGRDLVPRPRTAQSYPAQRPQGIQDAAGAPPACCLEMEAGSRNRPCHPRGQRMSPRALGPRQPVTASTAMPGWMVLGCCWILIIPAFLVWAAAWTAAALGGGHVISFGIGFAGDLAGRRTAAAWPGVSTPLVITCTCVLAAALTAIVWTTWVTVAPRFMHAPDDPVAALARHRRRQARLTLDSVAQRAVQLRRSVNGRRPRDITEDDAGIMLGDMLRPGQPPGPPLLSTWEETEVDFMGPRSGKTT